MNVTNEINYFYYRMSLHELQIMNENDYYKGLSYNSLLYINVIEQMENCTASKIAEVLNITKSAVTLKLNELVKQGAVIKTQSEEDRRVFFIKLSPHMQKVMSIYDEIFEKIEKNLYKNYSKEQLDLFGEILHTISNYEWKQIKTEQKVLSMVECKPTKADRGYKNE